MGKKVEKEPKVVVKGPMYDIVKRKHICSFSEAMFFLAGDILYIIMFIPICYLVLKLPDYNILSPEIRYFISKDSYFSSYFSTGKFVLWMTLMVTGFAFVNLVNLMNQRKNPFRGRDGKYTDFLKLIVISAFLYFVSPMITLRSRHDMQRDFQWGPFWEENLPVENRYPGCKGNLSCVEPYPILPWMPSFVRFVIREFAFAWGKVGLPVSSNCCYLYTDFEIVAHNMVFVMSYVLGLNYTHIDFPPFSQWGFNKHCIDNFTWVGWTMTGAFVTYVLGNLYYVFAAHSFTQSHWAYFAYTIALIAFFVIRTKLLKKTHYLHLHHWTCGLIFVPYCGFQNIYFCFLCGLVSGIMVEGCARWAFKPVWNRFAPPQEKSKVD